MAMIKDLNDLKKQEGDYHEAITYLEKSVQQLREKLKTVSSENDEKKKKLRLEVAKERERLLAFEKERDEYKEKLSKAKQTSLIVTNAIDSTSKSHTIDNDKSCGDSEEESKPNGLQSLISNIVAASKRKTTTK